MTTDAKQGRCPNCGSPNYELIASTAMVVGSIEHVNNVYQCRDCGVCAPKDLGAASYQLPLGLPILQVTRLEITHHD